MNRVGMAFLALAAALSMPGAARSETIAAASQSAVKAAYATKAPLLGIAWAGARLVAVGDYGVAILSDDRGKSWRQASSVATRNMLTAVTLQAHSKSPTM